MEVLIFQAGQSYSSVSDDLRKKMLFINNLMLVRSIQQNYCLGLIEQALQDAKIHYAILKGGILKTDYPGSFSRYMADLDCYIRPEDRTAIRNAFGRHRRSAQRR